MKNPLEKVYHHLINSLRIVEIIQFGNPPISTTHKIRSRIGKLQWEVYSLRVGRSKLSYDKPGEGLDPRGTT